MPIAKEILLRHRSPGHVRFQLPEELCSEDAATRLTQALLQLDGVYRVQSYRRQRKLSIRYVEETCAFLEVAKRLAAVARDVEKHLAATANKKPTASASKTSRFKEKLGGLKAGQWVKSKYQEGKETVQALGVLGRMGMKKKSGLLQDPEKAVTDFLNDVLVLYLIKTHWPLITQQWLPKPFKHRYEWLSVFYMMYLLMRSRMPKNK